MNWRELVASFWRLARSVGDTDAQQALGVARGLPSGFNRRSFLKGALAVSALAAVVDVDKMLWQKGEKTIFLPPADIALPTDAEVAVYGGNQFLTPQWVTREALRYLESTLEMQSKMNRICSDVNEIVRPRLGHTVNVRVPQHFTIKSGKTVELAGIAPVTKAVTLTDHLGVSLDAEVLGSCRTADEAREKVIRPMVKILASAIRQNKVDVFAKQHIPSQGVEAASVVSSRKTGLSVRGLKFPDALPGEPPKGTLYLDILGGSSGIPEAE